MQKYRIDKQGLWSLLEGWDPYLPRRVRLVACGGTALSVQDLKASTKDVDFLVPDEDEYKALVQTIAKLGYRPATGFGWSRGDGTILDLFPGKTIHVTGLLASPLDAGNSIPVKAFKKIEVRALNDYDLVISKMFRGASVDIEDCLLLIRARGRAFDLERLRARYEETAQYDVNPRRMMGNLEALLNELESSP